MDEGWLLNGRSPLHYWLKLLPDTFRALLRNAKQSGRFSELKMGGTDEEVWQTCDLDRQ